jgi:hypothetical protein
VTARKLPVAQPTKTLLEGYVARRDEVHHRALLGEKAPLTTFLAELHYPPPHKVYHWRIQLDCGCIVDRLGHTGEPTWLDEYSDDYYPGGRNKTKLPAGQWLCHNPECPRHRLVGGPVRDITEWISRDDEPYIMEGQEYEPDIVVPEKIYARWNVALSCGHRDTELVENLDWRPEDGFVPRPPPKGKYLGLRTLLKEIAKDADDEEYWRRVYAEKHPDPRPFVQCGTCKDVRGVAAYQCVGTLAPEPKPEPPLVPPKPNRAALERSLKKAEEKAAELRERLRGLDDK